MTTYEITECDITGNSTHGTEPQGMMEVFARLPASDRHIVNLDFHICEEAYDKLTLGTNIDDPREILVLFAGAMDDFTEYHLGEPIGVAIVTDGADGWGPFVYPVDHNSYTETLCKEMKKRLDEKGHLS